MPEVLKLSELPQYDCVSEVNIGCRWIDAEFDAQWAAEREFLAQLGFTDDLRSALLQDGKRFVRFHGATVAAAVNVAQLCKLRCASYKLAPPYLFLFSNSRTSSIVIGGFCRSNDFWLLPRSRKGRFPA